MIPVFQDGSDKKLVYRFNYQVDHIKYRVWWFMNACNIYNLHLNFMFWFDDLCLNYNYDQNPKNTTRHTYCTRNRMKTKYKRYLPKP